MYVQATSPDKRTTLFHADNSEITTGTITVTDAERLPIGDVFEFTEISEGGAASVILRAVYDEDRPTFIRRDEKETGWELAFAYWWDWECSALWFVAAPHPLYILSEDGKTIRRA